MRSTGMDILEVLDFSESLPLIELHDYQALIHSDNEFVRVWPESSNTGSTHILLVAQFVLSN